MLPLFQGKVFPKTGAAKRKVFSAYTSRRCYEFAKPISQIVPDQSENRQIASPTTGRTLSGRIQSVHDYPKNSTSCPLVDTEITNVITVNTRKTPMHPLQGSVLLGSIQNLDSMSFTVRFETKLLLCSEIYDFSNPGEESQEKEQKTRVLCELVQFFEQNNEAKKLPESLQEKTMKMIEANIIRPTPIIPMSPVLLDFTTVFVEPAWPQLFYVYQILNRFISLYPDSKYFNLNLMKMVIYLTNIPDNNERLQLLAFLRSYYDTHQAQKNDIIRLVRMKLIDIQDLESPPFCVTPLLVFLSHIYQRCNKQPPPDFYSLIRASVFPLILSPYLPLFHQHMVSLFMAIIVQGSYLVDEFHRMLIRFWPTSNGQKQSCFTEFILLCLSKMGPAQISSVIRPTLTLLGEVACGDQLHAAEVVFDFISSTKEKWVTDHSKRVVMTLFDRVKEVSLNHWSSLIRDKASAALIELGKLDRKAFLKARQAKPGEAVKRHQETEKTAMKSWQKVINQLRQTDIDHKGKQAEVKTTFYYKKNKK